MSSSVFQLRLVPFTGLSFNVFASAPLRLPFLPHPTSPPELRLRLPRSSAANISAADAGGGGVPRHPGGGGGGGGGGDSSGADQDPDEKPSGLRDPLSLFLEGWRSRVAADSQFPFKVLMEELVGVTACVAGDMASRPNFGLNELDFVFSTLVVGSIVNFVLMYLLAPTASLSSAAAGSSALPSYIFQPGPYTLPARLATMVSKGATFAAVGFAAGLAGTALSNGLIAARKKMDPAFQPPNKSPPTVLNALTWALHMGASSNLRYQTLNGIECVIGKVLPPVGFKASVIALRCLNNVLGGMSFVVLARMTGSQKANAEEKSGEGKNDAADNHGVSVSGSCRGPNLAESK